MLPTIVALFAATVVPLTPVGEEAGIGAYRGDPLPPPVSSLGAPTPTTQSATKQGVVFVNFDGATLQGEGEDSRLNKTMIGYTGEFAPYGDGPKREAIMQSLAADWAPYQVTLTQTRPDDGDYTMAMVGPTNFTDGSLGIALLDCGDSWTHNNIVYAFHHIDDNYSAAATATTIAQEVAHSYGLEHVDEPDDVMNPYNEGGDPSFLDDCVDIVPASFGILCKDQHEAACGDDSKQSSNRELIDLFGGSGPDVDAPTVIIESPGDGDAFDVGASFHIRVAADDDREVVRLRLYDGSAMLGEDVEAPFGWRVEDASEGEYRFVVEALDEAGNIGASQEVVVFIEAGGDPGLPDGDADPLDPVDPDTPIDGEGRAFDPSAAHWDGADPGRTQRYHAIDDVACRSGGSAPRLPTALLCVLLLLRRRAKLTVRH